MKNTLEEWLQSAKSYLINQGFRVSEVRAHPRGRGSVDIDGTNVVGGLSYWPDDQFEFQFNSCKSGEVLLLESPILCDPTAVQIYFEALLEKLPRT